jgi:predicted Fe-Mo cluster-binding NifX family protein
MIRNQILTAMTVLTLLRLCATLSAQNNAVLAVAAEGTTPEAKISTQAARSPYFLFFDQNGDLVDVVANPHITERRGAGHQMVEFLFAKGIHTVVAGEFGPKTLAAIKEKGMAYYIAVGAASEAVKHLLKEKENR